MPPPRRCAPPDFLAGKGSLTIEYLTGNYKLVAAAAEHNIAAVER
jgi:hypothetical protein